MSSPERVEVPGLGTFESMVRRISGSSGREIELVSWQARMPWYGADGTTGVDGTTGAEVTVTFYEDDSPIAAADLVGLGGRVLTFLEREETARREVATTMLELAQDWWSSRDDEESETELTLGQFIGLMRLDAVVMEQGGGLTVYYDDDDEVFAGHAIQASFDADGVLTNTDIPG